MILRQRQSCTFVGGHEVLSLVFAVVEAAGEDQVIVVTLQEDSVRGAIGQEGAPCGGGTGILCFWGLGQGHIPESLPYTIWPCLAKSGCLKSDLWDRELPLLGLDGGSSPSALQVE